MTSETIKLRDDSWITVKMLPESIIDIDFDKLWNLHPQKRHSIIMFDNEIPVNRWSETYMKIPKYDKSLKTSYMFSHHDIELPLPEEFLNYTDALSVLSAPNAPSALSALSDTKYNQVVVNWYANGEDNISHHTDYEVDRTDSISIITLNEIPDECRTFELVPICSTEKQHNIKATHKSVITMCGKTQQYYKHGIPKEPHIKGKRISITVRNYK